MKPMSEAYQTDHFFGGLSGSCANSTNENGDSRTSKGYRRSRSIRDEGQRDKELFW